MGEIHGSRRGGANSQLSGSGTHSLAGCLQRGGQITQGKGQLMPEMALSVVKSHINVETGSTLAGRRRESRRTWLCQPRKGAIASIL